jgi:hypothetical protein
MTACAPATAIEYSTYTTAKAPNAEGAREVAAAIEKPKLVRLDTPWSATPNSAVRPADDARRGLMTLIGLMRSHATASPFHALEPR